MLALAKHTVIGADKQLLPVAHVLVNINHVVHWHHILVSRRVLGLKLENLQKKRNI